MAGPRHPLRCVYHLNSKSKGYVHTAWVVDVMPMRFIKGIAKFPLKLIMHNTF